MPALCDTTDLLVFSLQSWDSVFKNTQHLMLRYARHRRVYYFEAAVFGIFKAPRLHFKVDQGSIKVIVPYLPRDLDGPAQDRALMVLIEKLIQEEKISNFTALYYTPLALSFTRNIKPAIVLFNCTDAKFPENENELMGIAHLVFSSDLAIYEMKKLSHHNIFLIPDGIDFDHFSKARSALSEPADQMNILHPRIGFHGVVDARFDCNLVKEIAELRPEFQFILIGPIEKIDPTLLPQLPNIHYLGQKDYQALPSYFSSWDCAFIPSLSGPASTPDFLAAGKPVVSTSIQEVLHPYEDAKIVYTADRAEQFVESIEKAINESSYDPEWLERVDQFIEQNSWDMIYSQLSDLEIKITNTQNRPRFPAYMDPAFMEIGIV